MKSYQFVILFGSSIGILFNGIILLFLQGSQTVSLLNLPLVYLAFILLIIYFINIIIALFLLNSKIVGIFSISSAVLISMLQVPALPGLSVVALLIAGGILALIRKSNNSGISRSA